MPTVLKEFEFVSRRKYQLERYSDGRIYRFKRGEDFDCEVPIFRNYVSTFAQRNSLRVSTSRDPFDHDAVVVQFEKPSRRTLRKSKVKP